MLFGAPASKSHWDHGVITEGFRIKAIIVFKHGAPRRLPEVHLGGGSPTLPAQQLAVVEVQNNLTCTAT